MDILFLIKTEQGEIDELLQGLELALAQPKQKSLNQEFQRLFERMQVYVSLDRELVYPELSELFGNSQKVIAQGYAHHDRILALLEEAKLVIERQGAMPEVSIPQELMASLVKEVRAHLSQQQELVLPRLRQLIPTQDREDLGQVYLDMKEDISSQGASLAVREQVG